VNFDLEDPAAPGSPLARAYTALVAETAAAPIELLRAAGHSLAAVLRPLETYPVWQRRASWAERSPRFCTMTLRWETC